MITPTVCGMYVWSLFTCWDNSDCPKPLLGLVGSWGHFLPWIYFYFSLPCLQWKGGSGNKWLLSINSQQSEERSGKAEDHPKLTLNFVRLNIFVEKAFLLEKQGNWLFLFFLLFLDIQCVKSEREVQSANTQLFRDDQYEIFAQKIVQYFTSSWHRSCHFSFKDLRCHFPIN